jgi:hypothetical protein
MRLTKLMIIFLVLSVAFIGLNCKDDEESEAAIPEKYIGTWEAKASIEGTLIQYAPADPPGSPGVDVRPLGGEIKVSLDRNGNYSLTFVDPIEGPDTQSGKVLLDEDNSLITMTPNDSEDDLLIFTYEWEDDITLILVTQAEFDFTLQGNPPVPAIVTIILKKTS